MTTIRDLLEAGTITMDTVVLGTPAFTRDNVLVLDGGKVYEVFENWRDGTGIVSHVVYMDVNHDGARITTMFADPTAAAAELKVVEERLRKARAAAEAAKGGA